MPEFLLSCIPATTQALPCEHAVEGGALYPAKICFQMICCSIADLPPYIKRWAYSTFHSQRAWTKSMCTVPWIPVIHLSATSQSESFWCSALQMPNDLMHPRVLNLELPRLSHMEDLHRPPDSLRTPFVTLWEICTSQCFRMSLFSCTSPFQSWLWEASFWHVIKP